MFPGISVWKHTIRRNILFLAKRTIFLHKQCSSSLTFYGITCLQGTLTGTDLYENKRRMQHHKRVLHSRAEEQHAHLGNHPSEQVLEITPASICNLLVFQPNSKASHNPSTRNTEVFPRESSALYKQGYFNQKREHRLFLEYRLQCALSRLPFYLLWQAKKAIPLIRQESSRFILLRCEWWETYIFAVTGRALQTANKARFSKAGCMTRNCSLLLSHQGMGEFPVKHCRRTEWTRDEMMAIQVQRKRQQILSWW